MNKKLVALAVAGVLSAPLAAQAQTANVTLYGRVNMTVEAVQVRSQPEGVSEPWIYRVNSNSSRLGVRGTESLGGGLNAIFQIESNVSADTGVSGGLGNRETFVGLTAFVGEKRDRIAELDPSFVAHMQDFHAALESPRHNAQERHAVAVILVHVRLNLEDEAGELGIRGQAFAFA